MKTTILSSFLIFAACGGDDSLPPAHPDAPAPARPDAPAPAKSACDQLGLVPSALPDAHPWFGSNAAQLTAFADAAGCASPTYDPAHKPVAMWDWDNTISKNDFGDAMTFFFIKNAKVLQPPGQDWHNTSEFMTDAAAAALTAACGTTVAAGQPLPTDTNTGCADELLSIYNNETTRAGAPAFTYGNDRRIEPAFAWTPQLMAGYTHAEIQQFTATEVAAEMAAPMDTTQTIGTTTGLNGWLRLYDQQKDMIAAQQSRGYDVWIITASPQDVIAAISPMVGIAADHVIGIRSLTDGSGKLTYKFEGCGDVPDGVAQVIPYVQGKRCYTNKIVFGETGPDAWRRRPDGQRWVFAAGDSDSDVEFLRDATYKIAINRNKGDLMCHAYYNENSSWIAQPMFIEPKAALAGDYACGSAFVDEAGASGPTRDEGGNPIPAQADAAHP